jgi:hypothetical protein
MKYVIQYFLLQEKVVNQNVVAEDIDGATKELKQYEDIVNKGLKSNRLCNLGSGLLINPMNLLFMKLGHVEEEKTIVEAEPVNV